MRVLEGAGQAPSGQRRAAFDHHGVAEPGRALFDKVTLHAYRVTDEDVTAAKRALSEDEIFELAVCAALGQATRQLDAALLALDAALAENH